MILATYNRDLSDGKVKPGFYGVGCWEISLWVRL